MKIILIPFAWLLRTLYQVTSNYGVALILFSLITKVILLPFNAKSKKSMMKTCSPGSKAQRAGEKIRGRQAKISAGGFQPLIKRKTSAPPADVCGPCCR